MDMILGNNCSYPEHDPSGINSNVIVFGGTGSGKTMSIMEPLLLQTAELGEGSLVVTLSKHQIAVKYAPLFRKMGYNVLDINFSDPRTSNCGFDPLKSIHSIRDITGLSKAIINADTRKERSATADPYWDNASEALLSALISLAIMKEERPNLSHVVQYMNTLNINGDESISSTLDDEFKRIAKIDPHHFAVTNWNSFSVLPRKTAGCVLSTMKVSLNSLFVDELVETMKMPRQIDITSLSRKKTVLFVTSSVVNPSFSTYVSIFLSQIFKELFEYGEKQPTGVLPLPVRIVCDDFACSGVTINDFDKYSSIVREKGISYMLLCQSESQLSSMYSAEEATTIINNSDTYIYLGGNDLQTARNIAARLNAPLEDVLFMPCGKEILFRRGTKPLITRRYEITRDTRYTYINSLFQKKCDRTA